MQVRRRRRDCGAQGAVNKHRARVWRYNRRATCESQVFPVQLHIRRYNLDRYSCVRTMEVVKSIHLTFWEVSRVTDRHVVRELEYQCLACIVDP